MKKNNLNINILLYILFNIFLLTLINDYISYFVNTKYIYSFLVSLGIIALINYILRNKIKLTNNFDKTDIIFAFLLFTIMAITIVYPDRCFDTFNYHLYLQENPFGNKISFDFFAGKNLNSYSYAFPDRMFYIFRYFLGYRLGVILNYFIIAVIYVQVKEILKKLLPSANKLTISIFALLTATSLSLIDIVDSYYVDLLSLVLLLEIFKLAVFTKFDNENSTIQLGYFGLLYGLTFAVKISNAILLILFFIIYVLRNKNIIKSINNKNIAVTCFCLIMPFALYAIYTYLQTGNPVFPFYNTIFHSKYFGNWNWLDTRFGPKGLKEALIWPLVILFDPKRSDDIAIIEPIWTYGYFVAIGYIGYYLYRKMIQKKIIASNRLLFFVTVVLTYFAWAKFQLGYSRYGLVVLVIGCIATYIFIHDIIKEKKYILLGISLPAMLFNCFYIGANYMYKNQDWIYNNYFNNKGTFKYNKHNLVARGNENSIELEKDSVWAIFYYNAGLAQMINNNIPIINVTSSADNDYTKELLDEKLSNASHIYTLIDSLDLSNFINSMNTTEYRITNVKSVLTSKILGRSSQFVYVFEIEKLGEKENNFDIFQDKEYDVEGKTKLSMFVGIAKDLNGAYSENLPLFIIGYKNGKETLIRKVSIPYNGNMIKLDLDVSSYDRIMLKSSDKNNEINLNNWFMNVNMNIN